MYQTHKQFCLSDILYAWIFDLFIFLLKGPPGNRYIWCHQKGQGPQTWVTAKECYQRKLGEVLVS